MSGTNIFCWGLNQDGQTGTNWDEYKDLMVVPSPSPVVDVSGIRFTWVGSARPAYGKCSNAVPCFDSHLYSDVVVNTVKKFHY